MVKHRSSRSNWSVKIADWHRNVRNAFRKLKPTSRTKNTAKAELQLAAENVFRKEMELTLVVPLAKLMNVLPASFNPHRFGEEDYVQNLLASEPENSQLLKEVQETSLVICPATRYEALFDSRSC